MSNTNLSPVRISNGKKFLETVFTAGMLAHNRPAITAKFTHLGDIQKSYNQWVDDCFDIIHAAINSGTRFNWTQNFRDTGNFMISLNNMKDKRKAA